MNAPNTEIDTNLATELAKDFPNAKLDPASLRPATPVKDDVERYLSHVTTVIGSLRRRMMDLEIEHTKERASLVQAAVDRVKSLDRDYDERMTRLNGMLAKLEAARDA